MPGINMTPIDRGPFGPVDDDTWEHMSDQQRLYLIYKTVGGMCQHCGASRNTWSRIVNVGVTAVAGFIGGAVAAICGYNPFSK